MYEYDFVKVRLGGFWQSKPQEDHHEIIRRRAQSGWRLVQILAPPTGPYGVAPHFELIFERPAEKTHDPPA
jgi:hypothetical protein